MGSLLSLLKIALDKRRHLLNDTSNNVLRLFNGFYEGCGRLSVDLYADTLVIHHMNRRESISQDDLTEISSFYCSELPDLQTILYKDRYAKDHAGASDSLLYGQIPTSEVREWGVRYPVNLSLNKDAGFYPDSALLRKWLTENCAGKRVLNTFAYTGSLGLAAFAGGAAAVCQTDLNKNYLRPQPCVEQELIYGDFFRVMGMLRHSERLFDVLILDPPFFSSTSGGRVDQLEHSVTLLNKIRPLAADGSKIIMLNNAVFLSGVRFMEQLASVCGEYLTLAETIPVPESFFGWESTASLPADPAPFNHSTKIAVLNVRRKDGRK